jgi:methyl-accepting chemotaxis protein
MRAEEEAKRARDQLTVTQAEIVTAVDAVQKVDGALADISGDVDAVHTLLASMAEDNMAQSAAITQITSAVGSMDRATQQNAAMVEETSAAARHLAVDVAGLAAQAGKFRTGSGTAAAAVARPRPAAAPKPASRPAPAGRRAANDPPKLRANGSAMAASADWSDF